jgi:hypothetical protein
MVVGMVDSSFSLEYLPSGCDWQASGWSDACEVLERHWGLPPLGRVTCIEETECRRRAR